MKYKVVIEGVRPILFHNRDPESEKLQSSKRAFNPDNIDPKEEASKVLYLDKQNQICTPSKHIKSAMSKAAADYQVPGKGKKTYKDYIKSGLLVDPLLIPHKNQEWELDEQFVRVKGSQILRRRPRIDTWSLEFYIDIIDTEILNPDIVKQILEAAGKYRGIGDFRPEYGLFKVVSFEQTE